MFYSKKILNKNVYCSDMIKTEHFFTSRDLIVKDNLSEIAKYLQIDLSNLIKTYLEKEELDKLKSQIKKIRGIVFYPLRPAERSMRSTAGSCGPV